MVLITIAGVLLLKLAWRYTVHALLFIGRSYGKTRVRISPTPQIKKMFDPRKKRVKVAVPARNQSGFGFDPNKHSYVVGTCEFYGVNPTFNCLQITVDRTPIFPVREDQIEIL